MSGGQVFRGDFDGDGFGDCAIRTVQGLEFHKGTGGGSFAPTPVSSPPSAVVCIPLSIQGLSAVADLNGDGRDDLVVTTNADVTQFGVYPYTVWLVPGEADGTFRCPSDSTQISSVSIATSYPAGGNLTIAGDFTSDGVQDIFLVGLAGGQHEKEAKWIILNGSPGATHVTVTISSPLFLVGAIGYVTSLSSGDADLDGHLDVTANLVVGGMGDGVTIPQTLIVYGSGDGTFHCLSGQTIACPNPKSCTGSGSCDPTSGAFGVCECTAPACTCPPPF